VLLLVEVSDATLSFDRGPKLRTYARAGIEEVWILNLQENVLEIHRRPGDGVYAESFVRQPGDLAAPLSIRDLSIEWARAIGR
jgi:Uma2 family endonuclease